MSLADKIASVLSAAPSSFDPDNDSVDNTTAQVTVPEIVEEEDPQEAEILSKFRKDNINLLADVDERYAGKKASRRSLVDEEDEDSDDSLEDESEASETENNVSQDDAPLSYSEDESEDDNDIEEESGSEDDYEDASLLSNDPTEAEFTHIKEDDVSNQVKKAICVKNQMAMWENLLEVRIQLQKCLFTANKMPQISTFNEIKQSCPEFSNKVSETRNILTGTLDKLLLLQETLVKQYPETKKVFKENNTKEISDDEEIPSDTESEHSKDESSTPVETNPKKRKTGDYESDIQQHHKKYRDYRNSVIQKWNDKTRIVVKKDGSSSHSLLNQIEFNLSNKEKLVKRTQLKRSQYEILGVEPNDSEVGEEYNTEIYDDDDFYHQLLRELIEVKSADITDPIQLGRQWIQLQNMRSKMKRKIDTRATKGRKIRYAVHSKLVNFMAPIDEQQWTDEAKNELYNSLFGKKQPNIQ